MAHLRKLFNPFPLRLFNYHKDKKSLTAEISTLSPVNSNWIHQIYDDACDVGIGIYSEKTEKTEYFYHSDTIIKDDEVCGWEFKPVNPKLDTVQKVTIFND